MSLTISILLLVFYVVSACLPAVFCGPVVIAESVATDDSAWRRVVSEKEEFSVLMPGVPSGYFNLITDNSGTRTIERIYSSYAKGSVYLVVSYDRYDISGTLENFKAHHLYQGEVRYERAVSVAGYAGKEYKLKFRSAVGTLQVFATKKHGYAVAIIQAREDPPLTKYFLSSFSLTSIPGDPTMDTTGTQAPPTIQASDLPASSETPATSGKQVDLRYVIVSKPEPEYVASGTGTVVLRVVLSYSGKVTNIHVIRGLPKGLTESAIVAAKQIKFVPAVKDGRFISQWVELQYNFN